MNHKYDKPIVIGGDCSKHKNWYKVPEVEVDAGKEMEIGGTAATAVLCLTYERALRELVEKAETLYDETLGAEGCEEFHKECRKALTKAKELLPK